MWIFGGNKHQKITRICLLWLRYTVNAGWKECISRECSKFVYLYDTPVKERRRKKNGRKTMEQCELKSSLFSWISVAFTVFVFIPFTVFLFVDIVPPFPHTHTHKNVRKRKNLNWNDLNSVFIWVYKYWIELWVRIVMFILHLRLYAHTHTHTRNFICFCCVLCVCVCVSGVVCRYSVCQSQHAIFVQMVFIFLVKTIANNNNNPAK